MILLAFLVFALLAGFLFFKLRKPIEIDPRSPPEPTGSVWLLGHAIEFGRNAVDFLLRAQKQCGDLFTIRLAHERITLVMDPHVQDEFSSTATFDFEPIQRQVNRNVFGFQLFDADLITRSAAKMIQGRQFFDKAMTQFCINLANAFNKHAPKGTHHPEEKSDKTQLREFTARTAFEPIFATIFGRSDKTSQHAFTQFRAFETFHEYFNFLWLGFPVKFLPSAAKAYKTMTELPLTSDVLKREDSLDYIRFAVELMMKNGQNQTDLLGHNLVYLHVNYNTFRVLFWAVYYLAKSPKWWEALRCELEEALTQNNEDSTETIFVTADEIDQLKLLDSIIKETFRKTSGVFMIRQVTADTWFRGKLLKSGEKVALYPPATHHNPAIFPQPDEFIHDRFVDKEFYYNGVPIKSAVTGFGTRCPGKRFATQQAKLYLVNLVLNFQVSIAADQTTEPDVNCYGHEILPPTRPIDISIRRIGSRRLQWH